MMTEISNVMTVITDDQQCHEEKNTGDVAFEKDAEETIDR